MSKILVVKHVPHEGLGTFEKPLKAAGAELQYLEAYEKGAVFPGANDLEGLIVMGGPMSVNEQKTYPFLKQECALIEQILKQQKPFMGVCLGAQLLAHVLGAEVSALPMKEIGWHPIMREPDADEDPMWEPFGQTETVFQWHGETFDLPKKAQQLFSAPLCPEQGFRYGKNAYGLQFHIEVSPAMIKSWMKVPVMKKELAELKGMVDPATIRSAIPEHASRLEMLSTHVAQQFSGLMSGAAK